MMEYYSAIKKNKIMPFSGRWLEMEIMLLNEISQSQKDKSPMFSLICRIYIFFKNQKRGKRDMAGERGQGRMMWRVNMIEIHNS
jgi:hypothetical protein